MTRLLIISQPIDTLVAKVTPDDAYYYFQAARNIVRGNGPSLDALNNANGFHPLWLALLLPIAPLSRDALVYGALALGVAVDFVTIFALWWAVGGLSQRSIVRLAAVAAYAFNPAIAFGVTNGLESSVSLLSLVLLFGLFLRSSAREATQYRYWALLGVASGVAVLARTDNAIFVLTILAFLALRRNAGLRPALVAGSVATLITVPWFIWNLATFGTPLQVSGEATYLFPHENFDPDGSRSFGEIAQHGAGFVKQAFLVSIPDLYFFSKPLLGVVVGGLLAAIGLAAARSSKARHLVGQHAPLLATLTLGFLVLVVVHAGLRWHTREWYFLPAVPLAALFLAFSLETTTAWLDDTRYSLAGLRYTVIAPMVALAVILGAQVDQGLDMWDHGRYFWQPDILAAARWLREETPVDAHVVGFNVGILSYFDDRTTTNLDGVMNPQALHALEDRRLLAYVDSLQADYLVDYDSYVFFYRLYWGGRVRSRLDPITSFHSPERVLFGSYRIYRFY